ncbi:hypothetical protein L1887_28408 [Cichorium endivia]|nr:hypothetical protein L1887_28408 [Cichorium endivia]
MCMILNYLISLRNCLFLVGVAISFCYATLPNPQKLRQTHFFISLKTLIQSVHQQLSRLIERDGEVEESYGTQPVAQGSQEWHQETEETPSHVHQRDGSQVLEEPKVCKEAQQADW